MIRKHSVYRAAGAKFFGCLIPEFSWGYSEDAGRASDLQPEQDKRISEYRQEPPSRKNIGFRSSVQDPSSNTSRSENDGVRPSERLRQAAEWRRHAESIRTCPGEPQGHPRPLCCGLTPPKRPPEPPIIFEKFLTILIKICLICC